jgi:hypothetical protein
MEVHHHPHLGKKNFKEYLLEGLMIFLAVSMGFIAENIRENIVEHEIEKRNMELVVNNLKEDTARINYSILKNEQLIVEIDSLLLLRDKNLKDSNTVKHLYAQFNRTFTSYPFLSNNTAFEQMKNSGSIRLVSKKNILDSLYKYDFWNKIIVFNGGKISDNLTKAIDEATTFMVYDKTHAYLRNIDQNAEALNRFYEYFFSMESQLSTTYICQLSIQLEGAKRLIKQLQDEYHLEKE